MKSISHLHISFKDFIGAKKWFSDILEIHPVNESKDLAVYQLGDVELAIHPDWGDGDTSFTLAFVSHDCKMDYNRAIERGAKPRTPPKNKGNALGADVFGPGKTIIEFEEKLNALG